MLRMLLASQGEGDLPLGRIGHENRTGANDIHWIGLGPRSHCLEAMGHWIPLADELGGGQVGKMTDLDMSCSEDQQQWAHL